MCTGFLLRVMKMFWNQIVVMVAQPCEYTQIHWVVHFQWVNGLCISAERSLCRGRKVLVWDEWGGEQGRKGIAGLRLHSYLPASNGMDGQRGRDRQMDVDWSAFRPEASGLGFGQWHCALIWNLLGTTLLGAWLPGQGGQVVETDCVESRHPPVGQI